MCSLISRSLVALGLLAAIAGSSASATVLTFDGAAFFPGRVPGSYGDYVNSDGLPNGQYQYSLDCGPTPDVEVQYGPPAADWGWVQSGFGDLNNFYHVDFGAGVINRNMEVIFAYNPSPFGGGSGNPTGLVYLYSFDLACQDGEALSIEGIEVVRTGGPQPTGVIWSQGWTLIPDTGRVHIDFGGSGPLVGEVLLLRVKLSNLSYKSDRVGIDNIKFGQNYVPSPGTAGLVLAGGLVLVGSRKRR